MILRTHGAVIAMTALLFLVGGVAHASTLLSTGFDGTTNDGSTLGNITYTTALGLGGPTSLSGNPLHTSSDAIGYYAPNVQVNNSMWDVDIPLTVTAGSVQIDAVQLDRQHFNVAGAFNTAGGKTYPIVVTLTGSTSGQVGQVTVDPNPWPTPAATETFNFGGVTLSNSESWTMNVKVNDGTGTNSGIFVGFDGFAVSGSVLTPAPLPTTPTPVKFANFTFDSSSFASTDNATFWSTSDLTAGPSVPLATNNGSGNPAPSLELSFGDVGPDLATSLAAGDYYAFTVTPQPGGLVSFDNLMFDFFKSNAAGANVQASLFSSIDGFASPGDVIDQVQLVGTIEDGAFFAKMFDLSGLPAVTGPVEFRIYIDDSNAANQANAFRLDNLMLNGAIQAAPVPEPATALLALVGLVGLTRRRRK